MGKAYTYVSRSFAGRVVVGPGGIKKVAINAPIYYEAEVAKFKEGDELSITLTNRRAKRTESQNNYWWGVYLPDILRAGKGSGTAIETHEEFARAFLTVKEWRNSKGQLCYIRKSTAELSVGQFCEFIVDVQNLTGVAAPPTENYGLAPLLSEDKKDDNNKDGGSRVDVSSGGAGKQTGSGDRVSDPAGPTSKRAGAGVSDSRAGGKKKIHKGPSDTSK